MQIGRNGHETGTLDETELVRKIENDNQRTQEQSSSGEKQKTNVDYKYQIIFRKHFLLNVGFIR